MDWDWGFPENVSTFGDRIDTTYGMIFIATALMFVLVEGLLIYFLIRYRHREGRRADPVHGHLWAEVVWTAVPLFGVLLLAFASINTWLDIKQAERMPGDAFPMAVHAKQFEWNVTYPGADARLGTADDFEVRNQLHLPMGRPVRVTLTAEDVIHSFFLPHFRVKQDAVPGMRIPVWFEATDTGEYVLGCAELCGLGHYRMRGSVSVHPLEEFDAWQASGGTVAFSRPAAPPTVAAR